MQGGDATGPQATYSPAQVPLVLGLPVALWQAVFCSSSHLFVRGYILEREVVFRLEPDFSLTNWSKVLFSPSFERALIYTSRLAATTTILSVVLAFPAAYTIAFRISPRLRAAATAFLIVPIFSSYLLRIYAWQIVLSPQGIVNVMLSGLGLEPIAMLGGSFSLQIGLLTLTLPVVILILVFALTGIDQSLIEAAENLGYNRAGVVRHVILPAIAPALILSATTSFLLSFGDYVSPVFMTGSKPPTLSILIVDTVKSGSQWPRPQS